MHHLVTGGAGFIGSHLTDALWARGDAVTILDDLSTGARENVQHLLDGDRVELVEGSVLDERLVDELIDAADSCFHLASVVGVELVVNRPLESLLANLRGVSTVTAAAARSGTQLLFASTSEVYGKLSDGALHEDSDRIYGPATMSRWGYATAKVVGEMLAYGYARERAAEIIVVRLFNAVGPRQTGTYGMVLPRFVGQALVGEDLTVHGDGKQTRCFTHVEDSVDAIMRLVDDGRAIGNVYNIGSQVETSIGELAARVIDRTGSDSKVQYVPYDEAYAAGFEELGRRRPNTNALEKLTGWRAQCDLDQAIDDVVTYQRQLVKTVELA